MDATGTIDGMATRIYQLRTELDVAEAHIQEDHAKLEYQARVIGELGTRLQQRENGEQAQSFDAQEQDADAQVKKHEQQIRHRDELLVEAKQEIMKLREKMVGLEKERDLAMEVGREVVKKRDAE